MELKIPSQSSRGLSPPDCVSDPEEQEVSDDDDDRNHKHRRRDTRSQSIERDQAVQILSRPYRKSSKAFENGSSFRHSDLQSHRNSDRIPLKFDKRRPSAASFSRFSSDLNPRFIMNQPFSGDLGFGRGRGRDPGAWGLRDSRFSSVDVASPLTQPGSIAPAMFAGRGLPNPQSASWGGGYGLFPGIPNGAMHPLGMQGSLGPPLNPSLNMAIPRQRCRDFEEQGFCLRGDMCPMEHGVNRIVVEDVQSLSQFNLPVSLPSGHMLGPTGSEAGPSALSSKGLHGRISKSGRDEEGYMLDGAPSSTVDANGADVYDPDQPLWATNCAETSIGQLALSPAHTDKTELLKKAENSDRMMRSSGSAVGLQSTSSSVWGRINSSKNRSQLREKMNCRINSSSMTEGTASHITKPSNARDFVGLSSTSETDSGHNVKRSKALKTLFVSGLPLKDNRREALLSHFRKFGQVIDIYIPSNSDRAFVQFSKREEAERALKSPDAVMGNRFIKLWWANRDNIVDDSAAGGSNMQVTSLNRVGPSKTTQTAVPNSGKHNIQFTASKVNVANASDNQSVLGTDTKHQTSFGLKAPPLVQKKSDWEHLKEELRKKQEMLEQKRNEFQQQLEKLQKQATGAKSEVSAHMPASKKQKVESSVDYVTARPSKSSEPQVQAEETQLKSQTAEKAVKLGFKPSPVESSNLKQGSKPFGIHGSPINRYKLDNRPMSFRINAPLPAEFANVNALREHFVPFGDLNSVELEEAEMKNGNDDDAYSSGINKNVSARISFKTRHAAERAFMNGKTWNDHILSLTWIRISPSSAGTQSEKSPTSKEPLDVEVKSEEKPPTSNPHDCSNGREPSSSAAKEASAVESQSRERLACDACQDGPVGSEDSPIFSALLTGEGHGQSVDKSAANGSSGTDGKVVENLGEGQPMKSGILDPAIDDLIEGERPNEEVS